MIQYMTIYDFLKPTIRVVELFGGIGACTAALKRIKTIDVEVVDYVEIDKYAVASYNAINGTDFKPQDITTWDKNLPQIDLIIHGSPCQDFSLAGKQAGGDEGSGTRSSLLYESIRIISKIKSRFVIWENVKNILSKKHRHNFDNYLKKMEQLGYKNYYQVLNSKDYGIPQNRERVFTISILNDESFDFEFPQKQELKLRLKDMLEDKVDEKYYLSKEKINRIVNWKAYQKPFERVIGKKSIVPTLTARGAGEKHGGMILLSEELENTTNFYLPIKNATPNIGVVALGNYSPREHNASRIVDKEGIAPIVMENHGTVTAIVENPNPICLNPKGGRNGIDGLQPSRKDRIYDAECISCTIGTNDFYNPSYMNNLHIRKLTPKECWRLMGFKDEEFEKAEKVCLNTQLYKQAGNSIVVDVLEKILINLLKGR